MNAYHSYNLFMNGEDEHSGLIHFDESEQLIIARPLDTDHAERLVLVNDDIAAIAAMGLTILTDDQLISLRDLINTRIAARAETERPPQTTKQ